MNDPRVLKRYSNRRLYDLESGKTVNLNDVAEFIRSGREIRVVDSMTGGDITHKVLGHAFLKVSQESENPELHTFFLSSLIRLVSGSPSSFFETILKSGIVETEISAEQMNKIVQSMVESGHLEHQEREDYVKNLLGSVNMVAGEQNESRSASDN